MDYKETLLYKVFSIEDELQFMNKNSQIIFKYFSWLFHTYFKDVCESNDILVVRDTLYESSLKPHANTYIHKKLGLGISLLLYSPDTVEYSNGLRGLPILSLLNYPEYMDGDKYHHRFIVSDSSTVNYYLLEANTRDTDLRAQVVISGGVLSRNTLELSYRLPGLTPDRFRSVYITSDLNRRVLAFMNKMNTLIKIRLKQEVSIPEVVYHIAKSA